MPSFPVFATFRDAKNQTATNHFFASGAVDEFAANALTIANLIDAASNASLDSATGLPAAAPPVTASAGKYSDIEDKCVVVLQTAAGSIHKVMIPAPVDACFLADNETMDGAGPGQAVGTGMIASCTTRDGTSFAAVVGGYRARVAEQRKYNIRTRNPALTGAGL